MNVMTGTDTYIHRMEIGEAIWSILSALSVLESQYCHFVIRNRAAKNLLIGCMVYGILYYEEAPMEF